MNLYAAEGVIGCAREAAASNPEDVGSNPAPLLCMMCGLPKYDGTDSGQVDEYGSTWIYCRTCDCWTEHPPEPLRCFSVSAELARCDAEVDRFKAALRDGHEDMFGLLAAISDWGAEARILKEVL